MRTRERRMRPHCLIVAFSLAMVAVAETCAAAEQAPAGPATNSSASNSEPLTEVTVTARRIELENRVSNFVYQIAATENEEGLPRWQKPVCPLVSGLSRQEGEFILERISEIARAAAVPLAGELCRPNLYIFVHPHPKELLQAMEKRNRVFTVGYDDTPPDVFDRFIATPLAVRVWYTTEERTLDGVLFVRRPGDLPPRMRATGSLLDIGVLWELAHVFVVVDQTRLQGVTRGQLADYVGMVALADLRPSANRSDAPTILKLFDNAPEAASAGMTEWDGAFLKALYATDRAATLQRSQIAHQMEREIAP
jgi:hypothetical protein